MTEVVTEPLRMCKSRPGTQVKGCGRELPLKAFYGQSHVCAECQKLKRAKDRQELKAFKDRKLAESLPPAQPFNAELDKEAITQLIHKCLAEYPGFIRA